MNDVWVFIEQDAGHLADVSLELLSKGRELSDQLRVNLCAILLGNEVADKANDIISLGADKVLIVEDPSLKFYTTLPFARNLISLAKTYAPQIILLGASPVGRDLAPRISSALGCGLTADCTGLEIKDLLFKQKEYKNLLVQTRPAFGGNILASIITPTARPQMATVREGVMKLHASDNKRKGEIIKIPFITDNKDSLFTIIERTKKESSKGLKTSDIVVAAGAGIGNKENLELLKDLANLLGGEIAASRAAVEKNLLPKECQIGQTGITVRPKLYLAFGISGAIQHRAGMEHSSVVVAFNNDPDAQIFKVADYCVLGDVKKTLPVFIDACNRKLTK